MREQLKFTGAGAASTLEFPSVPKVLRSSIAIASAVALLTLAAYIRVPMWPVPMTMQTLAVLSVGAFLGPALGGAALFTYLALGLLGLGVFTGAATGATGLEYLAGPTGGYLLGFAAAAIVVGGLLRMGWDRSLAKIAGALLLGNATIYLFGLAWMGVLFGEEKGLGWILQYGMYNFLPGDMLKIGILACAFTIWRTHRRTV